MFRKMKSKYDTHKRILIDKECISSENIKNLYADSACQSLFFEK